MAIQETRLNSEEMELLTKMHELFEMGEPKISSRDLLRTTGMWDALGVKNRWGHPIQEPAGDRLFSRSLGRLVVLGLVEKVQSESDKAIPPGEAIYKLHSGSPKS